LRFSRYLGVAAIAGAALLSAGIRQAQAAPIIHLPYPGGVAVSVLEGYNGGTHQGVELYSLDLTRDDGKSSGSPALAPAAGVVAWAQAPGGEHGCISIQLDGATNLYTMLCHLMLNHSYNNGDHISQGQQLGLVAPPGLVGNNGVSHIHLQLYNVLQGNRSPLPFAPPSGQPLEGVVLPVTGAYNDWACTSKQTRGCHIVSQNGVGAPSSAPASAPPTTRGASVTAAGGASSGAASLAGVAAQTLAVGQQVQVIGTGDCLRVHSSATTSANVVYCLPDGSQSVITDGPQVADGYNWWKLSSLGWAVADFLAPVDGSSTVTAAPAAAGATSAPATTATAAATTPPLPANPTPDASAPAAAQPAPAAQPDQPAAAPTPQLPVGYNFSQGENVVVAGTGDCLRVHTAASLSSNATDCLPDGTAATISDGPINQDGYVWFRLDGYGWVDSEYLQAA
jgi:hypothetical protein